MPLSISQQTEKPRSTRRTRRPNLTERRAKQLARELINEHAVSTAQFQIIDALAVAGALTTLQVQRLTGVSLRTLQRMHYDSGKKLGHFVDYVWGSEKLIDVGFEKSRSLKSLRVWKLGVLGKAVAIERGLTPVTYESSYRMKQITHDVCCAEIASRLFLHAGGSGWTGDWLNKNEGRIAAVKETKNKAGSYGLEPDSMLLLERVQDNKRLRLNFCIEFHNEIGRRKVIEKVKRYEEFAGAERYQEWGLQSMPYVLVGYRHKSILAAYSEIITPRIDKLKVNFVFVEQMGDWVNGDDMPTLSKHKKSGVMATLSDLFV